MKIRTKLLPVILAFVLALTLCSSAFAASADELDKAVKDTATYMLQTVKNPEVGSVGGEWAVIGLARSGYDVPASYYTTYYKAVEKYVKDHNGILHEKKYTDYSRVILGLTAAGYDPRNVGGYDLTIPLGDFESTVWQGVNGPIWALIALDSFNYPVPENKDAKTQATRELYIEEILKRQNPDGSWSLTANVSGQTNTNESGEPDLTGMSLQALAKYQDNPDVKAATSKALVFLSDLQDKSGGYTAWGDVNSESVVQVLVALCELGISADDARFVKNGHTLIDNILSFRNADGSFRHTGAGIGNAQMSSEQVLYGLAAAQRAANGQNSLYQMSDTVKRNEFAPVPAANAAIGLPGKHEDVKAVTVIAPGKTFADVKSGENKAAIEALASRGIINGKSDSVFDPDATMTRAEFAAIVTLALGLPEKTGTSVFADIPVSAWFEKPVNTAYFYEIVTGVSAAAFNPGGTITRQEAAVMTVRAAKLCGMDTVMDETAIRDTLAQFGDYRTIAGWAQSALAFCYAEGILDDSEFDIKPAEDIKRCEVAEMMYRMLRLAELM
ncbi:MAG: S-layer homology domain-containing protein [Clostridiales bacterium]|jgi:hypothetical protein|nr:S-layer homology domain-containing protein [Clostridiales bacterium]